MRFFQTRQRLLATLVCFGLPLAVESQPFAPGHVSPNFTLPNRNGESVQLTDFAGHVVVLDFFAFWCAPCSVSSPDIEESIQKHYEAAGGNPHGVPVQVLSINLEAESPESTDRFIQEADLDLVVNDFEQTAWNLYNLLGSRPSIPLFVILNGVTDSPSHAPWEVLHSQHGMYLLPRQTTAKAFRAIIDSVEAGPPPAEPALRPFQELKVSPGGWKVSDWFGRFNDRYYPWIYHDRLAWLLVSPTTDERDGLHFHDSVHGWLYTTPNDFPRMHSFQRRSWLHFDLEGRSQAPAFFDYQLQQWINPNP